MTIKTQEVEGKTRIITKVVDGVTKISCECCDSNSCCVYPAECGKGPDSVLHYGSTLSGDGTTFGDTTNGVILESGAWAVYRNGARTTRSCLGMATTGSINVSANLASSYALELSYEGPPAGVINTTLSFGGAITAQAGDPDVVFEADGQCYWTGESGSQDYDEGFSLVFNPASCRWLLATGPFTYLIGYLDSGSPVGSYTIFNPSNEEYAVIS